MIIQPFVFHGSDIRETYDQARRYVALLHQAGISVTLPDGFRSNTKTYPDHGTTSTVVEIFPDVESAAELLATEGLYAEVTQQSSVVVPGDWTRPTLAFGQEVWITAANRRGVSGSITGIEYDETRQEDGAPYQTIRYRVGSTWYRDVELSATQIALPGSGGGAPSVGDDFDPFLEDDDLP